MLFDSMLCMAFPKLARWVVVGKNFDGRIIHVLDHVKFMRRKHAQQWIDVEASPLVMSYYAIESMR